MTSKQMGEERQKVHQICGQTVNILWSEKGGEGKKIPKLCGSHIWEPPQSIQRGNELLMGVNRRGQKGETERERERERETILMLVAYHLSNMIIEHVIGYELTI